MTGSLILFTRFPEPGQTKTRLEPSLGPTGAADLHRALVLHAMATAESARSNVNFRLEIHHTGEQAPMRNWLGENHVYRPQSDGDLGARMLASLERASSPAVLMGTDCPGISTETLAKAFQILEQKQVVLGPAADGGYYLVGMQQPRSDIFRDMPWGSDRILGLTRDRLQESGVTWGETETLIDIDRPEDLQWLPAHLLPQQTRR